MNQITKNPYVKQCEQCAMYNRILKQNKLQRPDIKDEPIQEWYNFKNVKFFEAEKDENGREIIGDRYYCLDCIKSWENVEAEGDW